MRTTHRSEGGPGHAPSIPFRSIEATRRQAAPTRQGATVEAEPPVKFWLEAPSGSGLEGAGATTPWKITFRPFGRRGLRACVTGVESFKATLAYWKEILDEVKRRRSICLLLIDELEGRALTAAQWKALVDEMTGHGLERVRIAHVKPMGLDEVEYCEIFANEAGFESRVFTDERQATLWLRYGGDPG